MNEAHEQWKEMDQLTREAIALSGRLDRKAREVHPGFPAAIGEEGTKFRRISALAYRAYLRFERRRNKRYAISRQGL